MSFSIPQIMPWKYEITRPSDKCIICGQSIANLERHPSVLNGAEETEDTSTFTPTKTSAAEAEMTLLRYDYCLDCWEKVKTQLVFSRWFTRRVAKSGTDNREQKKSQKERMLQIFEQIMTNTAEPNRDAKLYILSHLLLRLRVFNWCGYEVETETGTRFLVFELVKTKEKIRIPQLQLSEQQLVEAQEFVDEILKQTGAQRK